MKRRPTPLSVHMANLERDPSRPARGVLNGVLIGVLSWLIIAFLLWRFA